jgi:DNA-directed RNA polymerase specialized sigma subunit
VKYPREYLWFVERLLRDYPSKLEELKEQEKTIEGLCNPSSLTEVLITGGETYSHQERVVIAKEGNKHYQWLLKQVARIEAGIDSLGEDEKELVQLLLFDGMQKVEVEEALELDEKTVWRMKVRALRKVMPFVIGEWAKK